MTNSRPAWWHFYRHYKKYLCVLLLRQILIFILLYFKCFSSDQEKVNLTVHEGGLMEGIMMVAISARYLTYFNTSIFVLDYAWLSQESSNNANSNMFKLENWHLIIEKLWLKIYSNICSNYFRHKSLGIIYFQWSWIWNS